MVEDKFREDLYYRPAVVSIKLPPLRERPADILLLAKAFLRKFCVQNEKGSLDFSSEAAGALEQHPWPGNVRELENRVKRAVIMAEGRRITPADLELAEPVADPRVRSLKEAREEVERQMV